MSYVGFWNSWSWRNHVELYWYGWTVQRVLTCLFLYYYSHLIILFLFSLWWICCIPESWFQIFLSKKNFQKWEHSKESTARMHGILHPFQCCFSVVVVIFSSAFLSFLLSSSFLLFFSPFYCLVFSHLPSHYFLFLLPFLLS